MANIGPLETYAKPGVYSRTTLEVLPTPGAAGFDRFAALIGAASDTIKVTKFPMYRGFDQFGNARVGYAGSAYPAITGDVFTADGSTQTFKLNYTPVTNNVSSVTNDPTDVVVKVDGKAVSAVMLNGSTGELVLPYPPEEGSLVDVSYFWRRGLELYSENILATGKAGTDSLYQTDADGWVSVRMPIFGSSNTAVAGTSVAVEDVLALDISTGKIVAVKNAVAFDVNGNSLPVVAIDGSSHRIQVTAQPGTFVGVRYAINRYANTYDTLPSNLVVDGSAIVYKNQSGALATDYVQDGNRIYWGRAIVVRDTAATVASAKLKSALEAHLADTYVTADGAAVLASNVATGGTISLTLDYNPTSGRGTGALDQAYAQSPLAIGKKPFVIIDGKECTVVSSVLGTDSKYAVVVKAPAAINAGTYAANYYADQFKSGSFNVRAKLWANRGGSESLYKELASLTITDAGNSVYTVSASVAFAGAIEDIAAVDLYKIKVGSHVLGNVTASVTSVSSGNASVSINFTSATPITLSGTETAEIGLAFYASSAAVGTMVFNFPGSELGTSAKWSKLGESGYAQILQSLTDIDGTGPASSALLTSFSPTDMQGILVYTSISDASSFVGKTTSVTVELVDNMVDGSSSVDFGVGTITGQYYVTFDVIRPSYEPFFVDSTDYIKFLGEPSVENELSLAAQVYYGNGGVGQLAVKPLKKRGNTVLPSDYIAGIAAFDEPMDDLGSRPSCIVALSTDRNVSSALAVSCITQSAITKRNERRGFFGFDKGTTYDAAAGFATALATNLVTAVFPTQVYLNVDAGTVVAGGEYAAVAMASLWSNGRFKGDISEPYTNKSLPAIIGLNAKLNDQQIGYLVNGGVTPLVMVNGVARIVQAVNTDVSSLLTREPQVSDVMLYIQRGVRNILEPFYGIKYSPDVIKVVQKTVDNWLTTLKGRGLISAYQPAVAKRSSVDLTTIDVDVVYSPTLPVNWILVTLNLKETL